MATAARLLRTHGSVAGGAGQTVAVYPWLESWWGTRESPDSSADPPYTYFFTGDDYYALYAPNPHARETADSSTHHVMWRFDFRRLQHTRSVLDFEEDHGEETGHLSVYTPIVEENCLFTVCCDRSSPSGRYPRMKYTWLAVPTLKFLSLRALFVSAPVEV